MSVSGHSERLDESGADFYPTPAWAIRAFARVYQPPSGVLFEPCCGDGAIIEAWPQPREWWAIDIQAELVEAALARPRGFQISWHGVGDCTRLNEIGPKVGAIITNPPNNRAPEIIKWALEKRDPRTDVVMHLPTSMTCAKPKTRPWMRDFAPDMYILSTRPRYKKNHEGKLGGDSREACWLVWPGGVEYPRREGRLFYCADQEGEAT